MPRPVPWTIAALLLASGSLAQPAITHGPFVGHTTPTGVRVWARFAVEGEYTMRIPTVAGEGFRCTAAAADEADRCVVFAIDGLHPATTYRYRIESRDAPILDDGTLRFRTAPAPGAKSRVRIAFGSCAGEDERTARVWRRIAVERPDVVVLLGDTPYIDKTDLAVQRRRYREFAAVTAMAELLRSTPWYGTWDDHDFGLNDTDGRLPGKASSRRAFVEYHAHPTYGDGRRGIYTSFRHGPVEVFLLDTRWFAATEPSPFRAHAASLLGEAQWRWLLDGLRESTAPFKVLACGMIWNAATRPGKLDHWGSYPHEREALFAHLKKHAIDGVVLVGGDVHRSRVIRHATESIAGYDLIELITSPMHWMIIPAANAPHPGLIKDMGTPHSFLLLDADSTRDPPTLHARFADADGRELFALQIH